LKAWQRAAGMTLAGNFKKISKKGKYLYNIKKLSLVFRGKMMEQLKLFKLPTVSSLVN